MKRILSAILVALAAALLAAGLALGDVSLVPHKAAMICLECMGIG
jgi:hypothetical protein